MIDVVLVNGSRRQWLKLKEEKRHLVLKKTGIPASAGTLCLCVPAFTKTPACVLVNIADVRDVQVWQHYS